MNGRSVTAAMAMVAMGAAAMACSSGGGTPATGGATCQPNGGTAAYPSGGCGTEQGDTIANLSFSGRPQGGTSARTTIQFSDYYNPTGDTTKARYLVIDVSALWCTYCKDEAPQLATLKQKYGTSVVFFTDLAQNEMSAPATDADVDAWITAYKLVTPIATDPMFQLGAYFDPTSMPLNMIVDLKTMKIVTKITGSGLPQVQSELDTLLATGAV
jgi:thiol-disulfide isomerase/thioredoxin